MHVNVSLSPVTFLEEDNMLKAHWSGYEIDSSEAAYNVKVPKPEELGTLVRALLGSGYFVRSYYLLSEESVSRLRDYVHKHEPADSPVRKQLDQVVGKFSGRQAAAIGIRAIEPILNYVGANRKALLKDKVFRFGLTPDQREIYRDTDMEFTPGQRVDEDVFYSESEIPWDGVAFCLGCQLVGLNKLSPEEQEEAREAVRGTDVMIQEEEGRPRRGGRGMNEMDTFFSGMFGPRDLWANYNRPQSLSLRVRLNPDASLSIHGRWMDDGQFAYGYYEYVLIQAAKKAGAKIGFHMSY
jgi:hypothetical protein